MKLRRGCGCPILLLLIIDLVFAAGATIGLIRGPTDQPIQATRMGAALTLVVMLANMVVCALLAMAAFREQPVGEKAEETAGEAYEEEAEVTEAEEDKES